MNQINQKMILTKKIKNIDELEKIKKEFNHENIKMIEIKSELDKKKIILVI